MIVQLGLSVLLSAAMLGLLGDAISPHDPETVFLLQIALVLACGYHRTIVSAEGKVSWWRLQLPTGSAVMMRNTLWGLPVSHPRKVRVSASTQAQVRAGSVSPKLRLILPTWLGWAIP